ncbi:histone-lysine N-methyltransferase SETMAR-like [Stegodyphus dumicola]|uniref:histone-lysine N-methyltransferase SETMAR-like n=1 Tax=Stegodyphus dumicola TaxID=202533 RepID=UPI0015AC2B88|nr:histone-lysine N-methyltransferase SETMAR-like [Stegodyphus dumicola]
MRSSTAEKFRFEKSKIKVMLITFFNCDGLIHHEFLPPNMTINGQFYTEVLDRLRNRILRVGPHFQQNVSWLLVHDNAGPHIALPVRRFLAQHGVEMQHPPYSPDLASADFFLFPKLKNSLKEQDFRMSKPSRKL